MLREFTNPIVLSSPHETGQRCKDAQYTLNGHNYFAVDWLKGPVDGDWGIGSAQAADAARWALGYPDNLCHTGVFGQQLFDFLRTDGQRVKLPLTYLARRKARLAAAHSVKAKSLALAATQIGTTESPAGSNLQKYGAWYGFNGVPWCAIFVTWCFANSGDTKVFRRGSRTAYAYWPEYQARAGLYGLRITTSPEPGDLVVYHYNQGHIEIFEKWVDQAKGEFQTVGGNTSESSDDNGGAVMRRQRLTSWAPTVFVRFPD